MRSEPTKKSVLIVVPFYVPAFRGGGPIRTIEGLTEEHQKKFDFFIFCSNHDLGQTDPLPVAKSEWTTRGPVQVFYADTSTKRSFIRDITSLRRLDFDFLYLNSFFSFGFSTLPALLAKLGYIHTSHAIIAPRGEFGHAALAISSTKKRVFLVITRLIQLHKGFVWHGSSDAEADEIRKLVPRGQVIVRQNETSLPNKATIGKWSPEVDVVRFIYIGRLSPKKRIELALRAFADISTTCHLDIYGEFEDRAYEGTIRTIANHLPDNVIVEFHGSLDHKAVRSKFAEADYFIFPTSHENFGHTIAESLSVGCPLLIQDVTPFSASVFEGNGIVVSDSSVQSWTRAIAAVISRTPAQHIAARNATAAAYNKWRDRSRQDSVFELAESLFADKELK